MPLTGYPFTILDSVDSTNNYAMAQVHAGFVKHGHTYFAYQQTSGKGQRNKQWNTGTGNIALSIVIQPDMLHLSEQFLFVMAVALSCYDLVKTVTGEHPTIKWPNDIYWCDRKTGGILIENVIQSGVWKYAIAGIGLNVNQILFPDFLPHAVSLKQITGQHYDVLQTARQLTGMVQNRYEQLHHNKAAIMDEYNSVLYKLGEPVKLKAGNVIFHATIKGVSRQGRLIVKNSVEQELNWGEVEWVG